MLIPVQFYEIVIHNTLRYPLTVPFRPPPPPPHRQRASFTPFHHSLYEALGRNDLTAIVIFSSSSPSCCCFYLWWCLPRDWWATRPMINSVTCSGLFEQSLFIVLVVLVPRSLSHYYYTHHHQRRHSSASAYRIVVAAERAEVTTSYDTPALFMLKGFPPGIDPITILLRVLISLAADCWVALSHLSVVSV